MTGQRVLAALPPVARKDKKAGMPEIDNIEAKGDFSNISHAPKAPNTCSQTISSMSLIITQSQWVIAG